MFGGKKGDVEDGARSMSGSRSLLSQEDYQYSRADLFLVTWDGPDDPANPRNWTTGKKFLVVIVLCVNTFCISIGSADISPAITRVKLQYGVSTEVATLVLSFYVFGWATGPLIFSPASEIFGRNSVYRPTWALFVLFNLGCALSKNITSLLACRLFAGIFSSTATAVGFGSAYDMFHPTQVGPPAFLMAMCAFLGPGLGPIIGGSLTEHSGWEYILWFNFIFAASMFGTWWLVPESHAPTLLARKARELRKKTGVEGLYTDAQRNGLPRSETFITAVWRPLQLLAFEPIVFLTALFVSFIWGILYLYLGAYIVVFRTRYGWGEAKAGAAFGGIAIGILLAGGMAGMANRIFVKLSEKYGKNGPFPEGRLPPAMLAAVLVPGSMFWFAWTGFTHVHWAVPVASGIPFGWCMVMLFISFATYASDSFPHIAASVGAANSLLRCLFAMSFPLVTPKLYERFEPEWAETILASITLLFIPVPFLFWKFGPWLRSKSKFQARFLNSELR